MRTIRSILLMVFVAVVWVSGLTLVGLLIAHALGKS
jgi:hypothetical protein